MISSVRTLTSGFLFLFFQTLLDRRYINNKQLTDIHIPNAEGERLAIYSGVPGFKSPVESPTTVCDIFCSIPVASANEEKKT
jgi:hypothetical protein